MSSDYWVQFWKDHGQRTRSEDPQTQVLRTLNRKPIDDEKWQYTLGVIEEVINPGPNDDILDLCCGNGLVARKLLESARSVTAVDVSDCLVKSIGEVKGITPIISDIRTVQFEPETFHKIVFYAGLQYFSDREVIAIFERVFLWLRTEGLFYIGDIPDVERIWTFYNDREREGAYFDSIKFGKPIIGTWFDRKFLQKLSNYVGFSQCRTLTQDKELIYSSYRFDMIMKK